MNLVIGAEENDVIVPVVSNSGLHRSQRLLLFDAYKGIYGRGAKARDIPRTRNALRHERISMPHRIYCVHIPMQCESPIPNCRARWLIREYGKKELPSLAVV